MFLLGLLLSICFVPGYTGATIPTQWAVLSIFLPLSVWRVSSLTPIHTLFVIGGAYALLSLAWTVNLYGAVWGLWMLALWALAFHFGTLLRDLRPLLRGIAIGLAVSTGLALAQALDYAPVLADDPYRPSGLFFNSTLLGTTCGLMLVCLAAHRLWWYMPPLALGLILSGSRGGIVILALGLLARYTNLLVASAGALAGFAFFAFAFDPADSERLRTWGVVINALSLLGQGIGSFDDVFYIRQTAAALIHPGFAHNDALQLIFELGPGALPLILAPALALVYGRGPERSALFAWCALSAFYFPLYSPLTAFIGLVLAGSLMRRRTLARGYHLDSGLDLIPWLAISRPSEAVSGREVVPLVNRNTNQTGA